jgi:heat shock protein HslJ
MLCAALAGCATTKVDVSGTGAGQPLCPADHPSTLVLWTTQWRPDQKDVLEREAAAWQGIQRFFVRSSCKTEIRNAAALPADAASFAKVVAITVRELGPVVRIGLPGLVEGGTEVVVETRISEGRSGRTLADLHTHWQDGGAFVIKGVGTLEQDMLSALAATFKEAETLGGSSWQLVKFQGGDGTLLRPDDKSNYTLAFNADGSLSARIDCNRARGAWKSAGNGQLEFGPMAITRAACPPGSLYDHMVKQLPYVRSYVMKDGHLFLSLMADGGTFELEPLR